MVDVNPVRTEQDYEAALAGIEGLIGAAPGTPEGDRLDVLVTLVQAYEAAQHPIDAPDPISLLQFVVEQRGLDRAALQPMLGNRGRVSEVMSRRRPLTLAMIRRLQTGLGLPADILVRPYPLQAPRAA